MADCFTLRVQQTGQPHHMNIEWLNLAVIPSLLAGTEFENAWRGFRGNISSQGAYLAAIPSQQIPQILKTALTPALLDGMLRAILFHCIVHASQAWGAEALESLALTPRFAVTRMGLASTHRTELARLWKAAEAGDPSGNLTSVYDVFSL